MENFASEIIQKQDPLKYILSTFSAFRDGDCRRRYERKG